MDEFITNTLKHCVSELNRTLKPDIKPHEADEVVAGVSEMLAMINRRIEERKKKEH